MQKFKHGKMYSVSKGIYRAKCFSCADDKACIHIIVEKLKKLFLMDVMKQACFILHRINNSTLHKKSPLQNGLLALIKDLTFSSHLNSIDIKYWNSQSLIEFPNYNYYSQSIMSLISYGFICTKTCWLGVESFTRQ
jgi:hypothetical protein